MKIKHKYFISLFFLFLLFFNINVLNAVSLRIVNPVNPHSITYPDTLINTGDSAYLQIWLETSDSYINTIQFRMTYDGTKIRLVDLSPVDTGINLQLLSPDTIGGPGGDSVLVNEGSYKQVSNDTIFFAAWTVADSIGVFRDTDVAIAAVLFEAKTNIADTVFIEFADIGLDTGTFAAYPDTPYYNVLTAATDSGVIAIQPVTGKCDAVFVYNQKFNDNIYQNEKQTPLGMFHLDTNAVVNLEYISISNAGTLDSSYISNM
ncbi:MAG TPA: hypothetical protein PLQ81_09695, partial [bacterium]|nr:hypothetical protein [bacterium]